jgi:hypothetical protein
MFYYVEVFHDRGIHRYSFGDVEPAREFAKLANLSLDVWLTKIYRSEYLGSAVSGTPASGSESNDGRP